MSYAVDWIGKIVTIPVADLTLKSGNEYNLDMSKFHIEIRRLESAFDGGLWTDNIIDHDNTKIDFAGADYAPFDEVINGYQIKFDLGSIQRVNLLGSNNNIVDVLVFTGVSVVPSNSAGLQRVNSGSGITEQDKDDIAVKTRDLVHGTEVFP